MKGFQDMIDVDGWVRNLIRDALAKGLDARNVATILRVCADHLDPSDDGSSWRNHWEATRPKSERAPEAVPTYSNPVSQWRVLWPSRGQQRR